MARKPATAKPRKAKKPGIDRAMSEQEALFLRHYLADPERNGTKAAIAAGYAEASARFQASRLLKRTNIAQHVASADARAVAAVERVADRYAITKERIAEELALIGFARMTDYMRVGHDGDPCLDFSEITPEQAAALSEVTVEDFKDGRGDEARDVRRVKFKLYDKRAALMDLAKLSGFVVEKQEHDIPALTAVMETIRGAVARTSAFPIGDAARRSRTIDHVAAPAVPQPAKGQTA